MTIKNPVCGNGIGTIQQRQLTEHWHINLSLDGTCKGLKASTLQHYRTHIGMNYWLETYLCCTYGGYSPPLKPSLIYPSLNMG